MWRLCPVRVCIPSVRYRVHLSSLPDNARALPPLPPASNWLLPETALALPPPPRSKWVESVDRRCVLRQEKLEQELSGYKTNLIKVWGRG